jgi:uncharacterized protein
MNFKPISVVDYPILKSFFIEQPYSLSVYSPASIIAWSNCLFKAHYAIADDILFIASETMQQPKDRHLILPISTNNGYSPSDLHRFARKLKFNQYWYVPGDYLDTMGQSDLEKLFIIKEQKEFEDYVYLTDDLIHLKGNKFSKKRNLIHQFSRGYLMDGRVAVESISQGHVDECLEFLEIWCNQHVCDTDQEVSLACEKAAVIKTLKHINQLESKGILIRIDGQVSAFGIGSRLNNSTATLNFEKAYSDVKGLYQYLDNECAKKLFADFRYINKESDMNIPNLAESKQSYNPVMRIKSFALILR